MKCARPCTAPAMKQLADLYEKKTGVKVLGYFGGMERNIITHKKEIKKIGDLKGLKMRAWSWKPAVQWWKDMGAIPAVMYVSRRSTPACRPVVVDGA